MTAGKLGRLPNDPRLPRLVADGYSPWSAAFLTGAAPPPPAADWYSRVASWPMYLNDQLGCCTCAEVGHQIESASLYAGRLVEVSDTAVERLYEIAGGYVPGDPSTDNGAMIQTVLTTWRRTGIAGHKCLAFAELPVRNTYRVRQAVAAFSSVDVGLIIDQADMDAFKAGQPWSTAYGTAGTLGGHSVQLAGYDPAGGWLITWGAVQRFTWAWWHARVEEAWLVIMPEWVEATRETPSGFDLYRLGLEMQQLTGDPNPFPAP